VGIAVPLVLQAVLIARSGQSFGKLAMRTRIVDEEGRTAGFFQAFVVRTLPFTLLGVVPSFWMIGDTDFETFRTLSIAVGLVSVVDALLIYGDDNRTLHDRIAGPYVCVVGTQRILREIAEARRSQAPRKKRRRRKAAV
jgi:uncharacterized RDD family membrane protein YckC